jgi:predicted dehydrogenase
MDEGVAKIKGRRLSKPGNSRQPARALTKNMIYGILGLGSIGARHGTTLKSLDAAVIAYDPSAQRRQQAEAEGIRTTPSREDVLKQSDAVIIASPNAFHLQDMRDALAAGCHMFVEKPLAHTTDGVKEMLDQATTKGLTVFAGLNLRFDPAVMAAKSLLEEGALGKPLWAVFLSSHYLPDWRPSQDYRQGYAADPATGGVLFDIIHEFDLANHLLGPAGTIAAAARNTGTIDIPSEDCADVILRHDSGVQSSLHLDYVTRPTRREVKIGGDKGILSINLVARKVALTTTDGTQIQRQSFEATDFSECYVKEMIAFIDCIDGKSAPPCDGYGALAVLEQVVSARRLCGLQTA